jgi:hypothetical protein
MQPLDHVVNSDIAWGTCYHFGLLQNTGLDYVFDYRGRFTSTWWSMDHRDVLANQTFLDSRLLSSVKALVDPLDIIISLGHQTRFLSFEQHFNKSLVLPGLKMSLQLGHRHFTPLKSDFVREHAQSQRLLKLFKFLHLTESYRNLLFIYFVNDSLG